MKLYTSSQGGNEAMDTAAGVLYERLAALFNDGQVIVSVRKIVGEYCIFFDHTNSTVFPNNISMNDKGWTRGLVTFDGGKFIIECPTAYYRHKDTAPFRKITADTAAEAVAKLVKWYEKHATAIKALSV